MKSNFAGKVKRFAQNPLTQLSVGLILLSTGLIEAIQNFDSSIGSQHGVMILGIINILSSFPDIIEGAATGAEYLETKKKSKTPSADNQSLSQRQ